MQDALQNLNLEHAPGTPAFLDELVHQAPVAIYTCDNDGYISFYNDAAVKLWGRAPELGKELWCGSWKIFYPDGKPMPLDSCPMARMLKDGVKFDSEEITIERPDHSVANLLVFPRPLYNGDNQVVGGYNTLIDISNQKSGEEKQAILSAIVESSDDAIISKTLDGIITSWNKGAEKIFGYSEDEVIGKHMSILIPLAHRAEEDNIISNIRAGNKIDHFQTVRLHKTGREINISLTVSPIKNAMNKVTGASKIARDISEQLRAERKIERNAEQLALLNMISKTISEKLEIRSILQHVIDASSDLTGATVGVFFYNARRENADASLVAISMTAMSTPGTEEMTTQLGNLGFDSTLKSTLKLDDIERYPEQEPLAAIAGLLKAFSLKSLLSVPVKSSSGVITGRIILAHPNAAAFSEEHENLIENISSLAAVALDNSKLIRDITAMSAKKDEFIALASHELKTPLTSIKGYLQFLGKTSANFNGAAFVEKALSQVDKLNSLIADLLDISRIKAGQLALNMEEFFLVDLLEEVIVNLSYTITTHKIILLDNEPVITVHADRHRLEQVLVNLVTNAVKYSPAGTRVWVSVKPGTENVTVYIKDEGMGLSPEQQSQVFTRFYRAEGTNHIAGLGLGLYLSEDIIKRHGGTIGVNSIPGKGAEFWFSIPRQLNMIS